MEYELKNKVEKSIAEALEYAYRRGYSHGFNFGSGNVKENEKLSKIMEWREDLSIMKGAPGSPFEDKDVIWWYDKGVN